MSVYVIGHPKIWRTLTLWAKTCRSAQSTARSAPGPHITVTIGNQEFQIFSTIILKFSNNTKYKSILSKYTEPGVRSVCLASLAIVTPYNQEFQAHISDSLPACSSSFCKPEWGFKLAKFNCVQWRSWPIFFKHFQRFDLSLIGIMCQACDIWLLEQATQIGLGKKMLKTIRISTLELQIQRVDCPLCPWQWQEQAWPPSLPPPLTLFAAQVSLHLGLRSMPPWRKIRPRKRFSPGKDFATEKDHLGELNIFINLRFTLGNQTSPYFF